LTAGTTPPTGAPQRIHGLDGLRGIAALVVLVHHTLLLTEQFIRPYRDPQPDTIGDIYWWLTYTPLHIFWDGSTAVFVFFVLSGFVLALPTRTRSMHWLSYYPARLIRLYLPVWVAVGIAFIWSLSIPQLSDGSSWLAGHQDPTATGVARDLLLVVGQPGSTISVLWSLRWEVVFSVLLPIFLIFAAKFRRFIGLKIVAVVGLILVGSYIGPSDRPHALQVVFQLPIFALGCLMAIEWDRMLALRDRFVAQFRHFYVALATIALLFLWSYWLLFALSLPESLENAASPATRALQVCGAAMLVFAVASKPRAGVVLSTRPVMWLGSRSFSLYLVHEPVVVAIGHLSVNPLNPLLALLISVPCSLLLAEGFFRVVERPSHRLSRHVAERIGSGTSTFAR
jgi:peptidoglycan/LPS O-acetylase OafA/YrhL